MLLTSWSQVNINYYERSYAKIKKNALLMVISYFMVLLYVASLSEGAFHWIYSIFGASVIRYQVIPCVFW